VTGERASAGRAPAPRAPLRAAFGTTDLRRCQAGAAVARLVDIATLVAVSVHLFGRAGAGAVALFGVVRTLVPAAGAPLVTSARVAARRPGLTLAGCMLVAALGSAATAGLLVARGPVAAILVVAGAGGVALSCVRPLVTALLPRCITGPAALVATNSAAAMVDNLATVLGPLLAGAALATVGGAWVLWASAALLATMAAASLSLDGRAVTADDGTGPADRRRGRVLEGVRGLWTSPPVRLVVGLTAAQTAVRGAVNVLVVSLAIDALGMGGGGVGLLLGAIGVGGLAGLPVAVRIAGQGRMARAFGWALVLWGVPLVGIGLVTSAPVAVACFAVVGLGNALVDITCDTLLQRLVPAGELTRLVGTADAVFYGGMALGAVAAERLLVLVGVGAALLVVGLVLPLLAAGAWVVLRRLDRRLTERDSDVALLQLDGILSPLMLSVVDHLARRVEQHRYEPGEVIVREGDPGHHYFLVEEGEVDVWVAGDHRRSLGPGEGFGEMALLDGAPRSATVVARTPVLVRSLDRDDFVGVVLRDDAARAAARAVAARRLDP
jgi:hypothetical protein